MCARSARSSPTQRLNDVLFQPGYGFRNLLAWGPGSGEPPELWAVRTGQQADDDFLLDQRRQPGEQRWLVREVDEPEERIEQGGVQGFVSMDCPGPKSTDSSPSKTCLSPCATMRRPRL